MSLASSWLARHRAQLAAPALVAALFVVQPAAAAGDPSAGVTAANQALQQAQAQAGGADQALAAARAQLASASADLSALDQHIASLNVTIAADTATVDSL